MGNAMLQLLTVFLELAGILGLVIALGTAFLWWIDRPSH